MNKLMPAFLGHPLNSQPHTIKRMLCILLFFYKINFTHQSKIECVKMHVDDDDDKQKMNEFKGGQFSGVGNLLTKVNNNWRTQHYIYQHPPILHFFLKK